MEETPVVRFNNSSNFERCLEEIRLKTSRPHVLHSQKAENLVEQEQITGLMSGVNFLGREAAERVSKVCPCPAGNIRNLKVFFVCLFRGGCTQRSAMPRQPFNTENTNKRPQHGTKSISIQDGCTSTPKVAGVICIPATPYKSAGQDKQLQSEKRHSRNS